MLVASPRRRTRREKIEAQLVCPVHDIFMNAGTFDSARVPHLERVRHEKSKHHFPVERIVSPNQRGLRFTEKSVIGGDCFMTFRVGQKVVCIVDFGPNPWGIECPQKDAIYIIREFDDRGKAPGLRVMEITNTPITWANVDGLIEPSFPVQYFRALVERKTSIEIFTAMLKPSKVDA